MTYTPNETLEEHPHFPIVLSTCEDRNQSRKLHQLSPSYGETASLFRVQDPFGLRKAIVPLFHADRAGILSGMGTGFALDPWGRFLTADHVIDFVRKSNASDGRYAVTPDNNVLALLGIGLIFGEVGVPSEAIVAMTDYFTPAVEVENPLDFTGTKARRPYDVAFIGSRTRPPADIIRNLPLRSRPTSPRVGELVVAIGFPEIELAHGPAADLPVAITEGMFAAYGRVSHLYPSGRDRTSPTPVFEVEANWPSGMSGGPVFNAAGEVIGLVSRSIAPANGEELGVAWATWLAGAVAPSMWPPSLDAGDAYWRNGWAAVRSDPWAVQGFPTTETDAENISQRLGADFSAKHVSQRLGTDTFTVLG
ncbi:S1 family peptidase [Rhizobium leguminosarum]|uniref:S1 family peptidase n=1 Tax=Rhizobium leguminosarum TaxID=384 RepID=UPI003F9C326C